MAVTINGTTGIDTPSLTADTTTLVVDETNNRVGIGTASPSSELTIATNGTIEMLGGSSALKFTREDTTTIAGNPLGAIEFAHTDTDDSGVAAKILGEGDGGTGEGRLEFYTGTPSSLAESMRLDSSGNLKFNSGYGSVATAYGCRAWVQFNGTGTVAIRGSGNVTSVTDQGVGKYDVNYTTSIVDDTYSCQVTKKNEAANAGFVIQVPDLLTTRTRVECFENNTLTDSGRVSVAVFR